MLLELLLSQGRENLLSEALAFDDGNLVNLLGPGSRGLELEVLDLGFPLGGFLASGFPTFTFHFADSDRADQRNAIQKGKLVHQRDALVVKDRKAEGRRYERRPGEEEVEHRITRPGGRVCALPCGDCPGQR